VGQCPLTQSEVASGRINPSPTKTFFTMELLRLRGDIPTKDQSEKRGNAPLFQQKTNIKNNIALLVGRSEARAVVAFKGAAIVNTKTVSL